MKATFALPAAAALAAVLLSGLSVTSCGYFYADQDTTALQLVGNVVVKREGDGPCSVTEFAKYYDEGVLDLAVSDEFAFNMHVRNLLPSTVSFTGNSAKQLRQEYNKITLQRMLVTLDLTAPTPNTPFGQKGTVTGAPVAAWSVPIQLVLEPESEKGLTLPAVPSRVAISGKLTDIGRDWRTRWLADAKRTERKQRIILQLQVEGVTLGEHTVRSDTFDYPVTVCWGCLINQPTPPSVIDTPDDFWRSCSTLAFPKEVPLPCYPGSQDPVVCGYYCFLCKTREAQGTGQKCDPKFCPPLL
ncbi:MAG: hypothetical protein EXR79_11465 [Myxococcales bacterium]|nr:hypothetical protein [Myxococcales bacterium]